MPPMVEVQLQTEHGIQELQITWPSEDAMRDDLMRVATQVRDERVIV
jgi:hypothetical protein